MKNVFQQRIVNTNTERRRPIRELSPSADVDRRRFCLVFCCFSGDDL